MHSALFSCQNMGRLEILLDSQTAWQRVRVAFTVQEGKECVGATEEWCMAVSGWFGLCSVGGQAPVQIKDFSVKVPDSATVIRV